MSCPNLENAPSTAGLTPRERPPLKMPMNASLTVRTVRLASSASWLLRRQPAAVHTSVAARRWSLRAVLPRRFRSSALRASGAGRLATDHSGRLTQCAVAGCRQGGGADHRVRGRELSTVRRHGRCRAVVIGSGGEQLIADLARLPETGRSVYWIQEQAQVHLRLLWLLKYFENVQR